MARRVELTPFGKRVKKRLIDKNMTQMELANIVQQALEEIMVLVLNALI